MLSLPDLLDNNGRHVKIANRSHRSSVKAGFYFANPRNRFWKALNACDFFHEPLEPSLASCNQLHQRYRIGLTDLVKRPTAGCKDLKAADYRAGSSRLQTIITQHQPHTIWFHGKLTCQKYIQYSNDKSRISRWGLQDWTIHNCPVFISPNPSPANAAYSLADISDSYQTLLQTLNKPTAC